MKKVTAGVLAAVFLLSCMTASVDAAPGQGRGGVMGFIAGCCFGLRAAVDYNAGKEIHWREWCRLIPYAGIVFGIWDGVEGYQGITRADLASKYGAMFY